jgi:Zn-dependent M28 family amino/carboxypeptidase
MAAMGQNRSRRLLVGLALLVLAASAARAIAAASSAPSSFDPERFLAHVRALASDAFEGRAPGTKGEEVTTAYIAEQFRALGLRPSGESGTYFEPVPLVGSTATLSPLTFRKGDTTQVLAVRDDFVAWTKRAVPSTALVDSELVFVGYGVEAPEANWDDYKGVDLAGRTMVVLVGDPPVPDPADPSRLDPGVFGGKAMTYYGRWAYKYDTGTAHKAAGVLIVHETGPAGYPFSIVQGRLSEQFDLRAADNNVGRPAVEGWITLDRARDLFALAGRDFDALKREAATRAFRPVPLGVTASMTVTNVLRRVDSRNVAAVLEGSDASLRNEHVAYLAHWDSFGRGAPVDGETIRHGAVDNATGVAALLEVARAFATAPARPKRSLLFLAVTAEEQGLLGSESYVRHPIVPLERTLAALNFEMLNVYGRTADITVYGLGASDLDDRIRAAAAKQGRAVKPDPAADQGWFYRSDHFPFARAGVPATWLGGGNDYIGKPADYGRRMREEYVATRYHKPADVVRPDWDLAGAMEDLEIYFEVGRDVADGTGYPVWKPGAEFKARRDQMLRRRE